MGKKHKKHKSTPEDDQPLPKLVLKVHKDDNKDGECSRSDTHGSKPHKKKKKKDKKHKHRDEEGSHRKSKKRERSDHGAVEGEPSVKKLHIKLNESSSAAAHPLPAAKVPPSNMAPHDGLRLCLENLHRTLQRKDVCGVFAFPVTDAIAPGYSKIIKHSMDFSTMMIKIDQGGYSTLEEFKDDFILMCDNAMIYNSQDTIYYKAAEKLRSYGMKLLSKEKLKHLKRSVGLTYSSDDYESDPADNCADDSGLIDVDTVETRILPNTKKAPLKKRRENKTAEITASILRSAKMVARKVKRRNPNGKIGFLRKDADGNTTLAVLNPDAAIGGESNVVTIGTLAGKVKKEQGAVHPKEETKSASIPVSYLMYGPYGSFAPSHDSSLANLSKEDSDLLITTYGSDQGVQYAKSLQNYVKDSPVFAQDLVDRFLNALTNGSHGAMLKIQQQKTQKEAAALAKSTLKTEKLEEASLPKNTIGDDLSHSVDVEALKSLAQEGIDMSFLDMIVQEKKLKEAAASDLKKKLNANSALLEDLQRTQAERLANPSKRGSSQVSEKETGIADVLAVNLKNLLSEVAPGDVANQDSLSTALGMGLVTSEKSASEGQVQQSS